MREKRGVAVPPDDEFAAALVADDRVLLTTPATAPSAWTTIGLD